MSSFTFRVAQTLLQTVSHCYTTCIFIIPKKGVCRPEQLQLLNLVSEKIIPFWSHCFCALGSPFWCWQECRYSALGSLFCLFLGGGLFLPPKILVTCIIPLLSLTWLLVFSLSRLISFPTLNHFLMINISHPTILSPTKGLYFKSFRNARTSPYIVPICLFSTVW